MAIRIITDSPSDITTEEAKLLNISIVPLRINVDDKSFKEGIDITTEEFYNKLEKSDTLPKTSAPSPDDFLAHYDEAKKAGDEVIVITLAASLSASYQSAVIAKELAEYSKIHVIDSKQASIGEMVLVRYAIRLRDEGKTAKEIVEILEKAKDKIILIAIVETLDYLQKGGRLSKTVALAGGLLNIKPIITVKDGAISLIAKPRGIKGAMKNLLSSIDDYDNFNLAAPVVYGYTGNLSDNIEVFKEQADEKYNLEGTNIYRIGSVIGTHAGPGAFGIAFLQK